LPSITDIGSYVWGDNVHKAKSQCERYFIHNPMIPHDADIFFISLDYIFQLAVEMKKLELPWVSEIE
jgi:methylthioribulose-1-phosphate dehydratase